MDVRNWSMDQILMLPDHCLSRRYSVFVALDMLEDTTAWDISELALPDRAIIHEMRIIGSGPLGKYCNIRLALGDQLPTATAMVDVLEPLFMGLGFQGAEPRSVPVGSGPAIYFNRLRMFVSAQGRRLVLEATTGAGFNIRVLAGIVVSAVPTEVPDWLLSV